MKLLLISILSLSLFSCGNKVSEGRGMKVISCRYVSSPSVASNWSYETEVSSNEGSFKFYSNKKFAVGDIVTLSVISQSNILPEKP